MKRLCPALACALFFLSTSPLLQAAQGPQEELKELFERVELQMQRIDELLNNAASGKTGSLSQVEGSDIDKLLKATESQGKEVIQDINRILEIAQSQGGQQSSSSSSSSSQGQSSSGEQQSSGQSPSPLDRGQQSSSRESTPEAPNPSGEEPGQSPGEEGQEEPQGEKPGEEPGGEKPQPGEGDPKSPLDANDPNRENIEGKDPSADATAPPPGTVRDADRWGALPLQTRRTFRAEGDGDVPPAYRDWIDAYYRRLNRDDK